VKIHQRLHEFDGFCAKIRVSSGFNRLDQLFDALHLILDICVFSHK
jgi:hypothetical protein